MHKPKTVLVLCTGNSCRSQMGEAILNQALAGRVRALSAGTRPQPQVAPLALTALARAGVPGEGLVPKPVEAVLGEAIDLVVTVCDNARESCPVFPQSVPRLHLSFPDPHGQPLAAFVALEKDIRTRLVPAVAQALGLQEAP